MHQKPDEGLFGEFWAEENGAVLYASNHYYNSYLAARW